ncbi:MAG: antitoxin epsilon, partial [Clostridia bacterium]|nr:antitoxin epsilon [Clostridia bacterium]MBR2787266.1 antitoxin epsilon [Clostridia bacterium]
KKDRTTLQSNLLNQLSVMKQIDLFSLSLDKLKYYHEYLLATKKYAEAIT